MKLICDALRDLVPFVQFKKCKKHPWRSVIFSKVAGFSLFLNCTNGTKSRKTSHTYIQFYEHPWNVAISHQDYLVICLIRFIVCRRLE